MKAKLSIQLALLLVIVAIVFSLGIDMSLTANAVTDREIRATIERARTAWVERDARSLADLFTDDGELIVPGQRWQGRSRIEAEVTKFGRQYRDVSITISRVIVEGDRAAVEWHYEDTEIATGKRNRADDAIAIDFQAGKISRWREYFDTASPQVE